MDTPPRFVGVDVSEARFDGYRRPQGDRFDHPDDEAGIAAFGARKRNTTLESILSQKRFETAGGPG